MLIVGGGVSGFGEVMLIGEDIGGAIGESMPQPPSLVG
jgi:hypothetical protein